MIDDYYICVEWDVKLYHTIPYDRCLLEHFFCHCQ